MRSMTLCGRFCGIIVLLGLLPGCALWKAETWDLNNYRDERARDIDARLSSDVPIGPSPFGGAAN